MSNNQPQKDTIYKINNLLPQLVNQVKTSCIECKMEELPCSCELIDEIFKETFPFKMFIDTGIDERLLDTSAIKEIKYDPASKSVTIIKITTSGNIPDDYLKEFFKLYENIDEIYIENETPNQESKTIKPSHPKKDSNSTTKNNSKKHKKQSNFEVVVFANNPEKFKIASQNPVGQQDTSEWWSKIVRSLLFSGAGGAGGYLLGKLFLEDYISPKWLAIAGGLLGFLLNSVFPSGSQSQALSALGLAPTTLSPVAPSSLTADEFYRLATELIRRQHMTKPFIKANSANQSNLLIDKISSINKVQNQDFNKESNYQQFNDYSIPFNKLIYRIYKAKSINELNKEKLAGFLEASRLLLNNNGNIHPYAIVKLASELTSDKNIIEKISRILFELNEITDHEFDKYDNMNIIGALTEEIIEGLNL